MKRLFLGVVTFALLLSSAAAVRANWFSCVMDPYSTYGHPSFYFPPAVAAMYAGYGYSSIIPGTVYYTPTVETSPPVLHPPAYLPGHDPHPMPWFYVPMPYPATPPYWDHP